MLFLTETLSISKRGELGFAIEFIFAKINKEYWHVIKIL